VEAAWHTGPAADPTPVRTKREASYSQEVLARSNASFRTDSIDKIVS
jgi:hypothetical protein